MSEVRLIDANALRAEYQAILDRGDMFCEYDIVGMVDNAPTVEPTFGLFKEMLCAECGKRPQSEWIEGKNGNIKCNQCGCEIRYSYLIGNKPDFPKFCCDCGAKMRKEVEE